MRAAEVRIIIAAPYYDVRHARFVAEATGATVVPLAHQTGSREGTDGYVEMIDHNVNRLVQALGNGDTAKQQDPR
jgi:ABC-type Zn uptake system ZnuABC Zn-binding protein ZnuA